MNVPQSNPARDAVEVLQRLLALIDSVRQPQDLTPEQVTRFSGLPMRRINTPNDFYYLADQDLSEVWSYNFYWGLNNTTKLPEVGFEFEPIDRLVSRPSMESVCQLDVARFHDVLLGLRYEHVSSTRRATLARQYRRGAVEVEVGIVGESGESLEKISHNCIKRVLLDFSTLYLKEGAQ